MLVSIFLLTHSALPHIHHNGVVCITSDISEHSDCNNKVNNNPTNEDSDCLIRSINAIHNHSEKISNIIENSYSLLFLFTINLFSNLYIDVASSGFAFEYKPYNNNYHTPFVGTYYNLRAPPVFSFIA